MSDGEEASSSGSSSETEESNSRGERARSPRLAYSLYPSAEQGVGKGSPGKGEASDGETDPPPPEPPHAAGAKPLEPIQLENQDKNNTVCFNITKPNRYSSDGSCYCSLSSRKSI